MRHLGQQALASYSPASAVPPSLVAQETVQLTAEIIPLNFECGGWTIETTYSIRNGIVTVKYRSKTLSTYSSQGDEANHKVIARQLPNVMLSI